jgi:hypothetical protein
MVCGVSLERLPFFRRPAAPVFVVGTILVATAVLIVGFDANSAPAASPAGSITKPTRTQVSSSPAPSPREIVVTMQRCAQRWSPPTAGRVTFRIVNRTDRAGEIYLFNPYFGVTTAKAAVHPGTTESLSVRLKAGRYQWTCRLDGQPARTSS